jgi:hypothetical protein
MTVVAHVGGVNAATISRNNAFSVNGPPKS